MYVCVMCDVCVCVGVYMRVWFYLGSQPFLSHSTGPCSSYTHIQQSTAMDLDALLAQEIEELNRDTEEDRRVKEAVIVAKRDPNKISGDDDDSSDDDLVEAGMYPHYSDDDDYYEDDLELRDPELFRITERNRQILLDDDQHMPARKKSISAAARPPELVFSDPPMTVTEPDRIVVNFSYGTSPNRPVTKSRKYLMACDFGEESTYAMNWAMGTMLRDGDEIHVAAVVNIEDDVDDMDEDEKYRLWQEVNHDGNVHNAWLIPLEYT